VQGDTGVDVAEARIETVGAGVAGADRKAHTGVAVGGDGSLGRLQQGCPDPVVAARREYKDVLEIGQRVHQVCHQEGGRPAPVEEDLTHGAAALPGHQVEAFIAALPLQPVRDHDPVTEGGGHRGGLVDT
jgi:hypothetical protein